MILLGAILHWVITAVIFLVILTVLVLIHEAGHFFMAKLFGIKVEEFGFGFPPRAWGKKIGETIYSINWLPIGGFVKLFGEDEAGGGRISTKTLSHEIHGKERDRAFFLRPAWQRLLVIFAGVLMNTILAFFIFYLFLGLSGFKTTFPVLGNPQFIGAEQTKIPSGVIIGSVVSDSPAQMAGIKTPAIVLSVNNRTVTDINSFITTINKEKGKDVTISWQEITDGTVHSGIMIPRVSPPKGQGALGVAIDYSQYPTVILDYKTPAEKLFSGVSHSINMIIYTIDGFAKLIHMSVQEKSVGPVSKGFSGPVGIFSFVSLIIQIPSAKEALLQLLNLAGLLSISLAFFNVLPIPALDGGRLFFIVLEVIFRRKLNPKFENYANTIGMAILLMLVLLITLKDIRQFFF